MLFLNRTTYTDNSRFDIKHISSMYAIVEWVGEDLRQVSVVPKSRMNENATTCVWPPPDIARKIKRKDLNSTSDEAAFRLISGTARSMGIEVVE